MLESIELTWRLLSAIPLSRYLQLLPWHFTAILIALGVLSAIGIHHLIGWTFGLYSPWGFKIRVGAAVTLTVILVSIQGLLLAYVLRTQSEALVRPALAPEDAVQPAGVLGSILLDPAFASEDLADETHVAKDSLAAVIVGMDDDDYRGGLATFLVSPSQLMMAPPPGSAPAAGTEPPKPPAPGTQGAKPESDAHGAVAPPAFTNRDDLISAIIVQIGLRWVLDPKQTWPQAMPAGTGSTEEQRLRLPEFALALVDEMQDDAVLDRLNWEHVAGTRFVQAVLLPVLLELIGRSAGLLAIGVIALDLAYFAIAARIVGMQRRRAKGQPPEKDAAT